MIVNYASLTWRRILGVGRTFITETCLGKKFPVLILPGFGKNLLGEGDHPIVF